MKAVVVEEYGLSDKLTIKSVEVPKAKRDFIVVKVNSIGVNYADIARRYGKYVVPTPVPFIPGLEVAGTVTAVGEGVEELSVGTRVMALLQDGGGYAEYALVHKSAVFTISEGVSDEVAAALGVQGLTAYYMLKWSGSLEPGESVLVHAAAGGVGLLALQMAKRFGAGLVIGTASTDKKRALALEHGADAVLDYTRPQWVDELKRTTKNWGADVVLEMAGGAILMQSLQTLAPFGRLVLFGAASGETMNIDPYRLMGKNQSITGFFLTTAMRKPAWAKVAMEQMFNWIREGTLKVRIGGVYALEEAARAQDVLEGRQTTGKLILKP